MNGATAKLIGRYSNYAYAPHGEVKKKQIINPAKRRRRGLKKQWNSVPQNERRELKDFMERTIRVNTPK